MNAIEQRLPDHDPEEQARLERAANNSIWVSVAVNVVLTVLQVIVGIFAKSQALVADGMHSLSDLLADFVALIAARHSRKEADSDHPYGHRRYENAASLALGALLLAVGIGMVFSAIKKFENPGSIPVVHQAALWVALFTLAAKEGLFRYMLAAAKKVHSSMLVANAWHARSDAASSLVVAVGIVGNLMGYPILDPIAALIVGLMVGKVGWKFGWQALQDLMDAAADDETVMAIKQTILAQTGVLGLHDLRTRKMGDAIIVDVHIEVDDRLSVVAGHNIAVESRLAVMQAHPVLDVLIHVDPVNMDSGQSYDPPEPTLP
ncbi:MAG: cation diffusion facilitator family transporter [Neisseria sp.]|nr:cation diffusion facilitator family transporter [Neisseria sp.]